MEGVSRPEFRSVGTSGETGRDRAIREICDAIHRANEAIRRAVDSGVSVELVRVSRYHEGRGHWGDQVIPAIHGTGPAAN
jgi:hypothetical protein